MAKIDDIKKEIAEYKELIADANVPQDEKDFAKGEIDELEKTLAELEKKEAKTEAKAEGKEKKGSTSHYVKKAPKRKEGEADCVELEKREESAKKSGYDIDELLTKARTQKAKAKARAEARKNEPKKRPATKNHEAVERTTDKVTKNVEKRAEKGEATESEIQTLINEYKLAIKKLESVLEKMKAEKKKRGGNTKKKNLKPKMVRTQFEEGDYGYRKGGKA